MKQERLRYALCVHLDADAQGRDRSRFVLRGERARLRRRRRLARLVFEIPLHCLAVLVARVIQTFEHGRS